MSTVTFTVFRGSKSGKIVKDITTRTLRDFDAFVELRHSGLCGTDEHYLHSGCVLGHEGVGIVREVGRAVKSVETGDRVGFGYLHDICGQCEYCLSNKEQYCPEVRMYGRVNLDEGSFGTHIVWKSDMLVKIPEGYDLKDAAPLMCAGATVWTALTTFGLQAGDRVGVQGIGGLGHLAIQFASKLGCKVTVLSSSTEKREESRQLGATDYYVLEEKLDLPANQKLKQLLICGSANPDYVKLISLVAAGGIIFPLTVSQEATPIHLHDLVTKGIRIQGSVVASRNSTRKMLEFAAYHGIKPMLMEWPMTEGGVETAMQTLRDGKMRYRGLLTVEL